LSARGETDLKREEANRPLHAGRRLTVGDHNKKECGDQGGARLQEVKSGYMPVRRGWLGHEQFG